MTGGSYWHKVNASELHFARSFQGHPIWPYLARSITCPNTAKYTKYGIWGAYSGAFHSECTASAVFLHKSQSLSPVPYQHCWLFLTFCPSSSRWREKRRWGKPRWKRAWTWSRGSLSSWWWWWCGDHDYFCGYHGGKNGSLWSIDITLALSDG